MKFLKFSIECSNMYFDEIEYELSVYVIFWLLNISENESHEIPLLI